MLTTAQCSAYLFKVLNCSKKHLFCLVEAHACKIPNQPNIAGQTEVMSALCGEKDTAACHQLSPVSSAGAWKC